jgi:hypothetical protein
VTLLHHPNILTAVRLQGNSVKDGPASFSWLNEPSSKKRAKIERRYLDDIYGLIDGVKLGLGRAVLPQHLIKGVAGLTVANSERTLSIPVVLHFFMLSPIIHNSINLS